MRIIEYVGYLKYPKQWYDFYINNYIKNITSNQIMCGDCVMAYNYGNNFKDFIY